MEDEGAEAGSDSKANRWDATRPDSPGGARTRRFGIMGGGGTLALRLLAVVLLGAAAMYLGLVGVKPDPAADAGASAPVRAPIILPVAPLPADIASPAQAPPPERMEAPGLLRDLRAPGVSDAFIRSVREAPDAICRDLTAKGWDATPWAPSPMGQGSECTAGRSYGPKGGTRSFAILRGGETLSEIRIKLNLLDAGTRLQAARDAADLVAHLFERWQWMGAESLSTRIAALEPFEETLLGTRIRFSREYGTAERFNLLLDVPASPTSEASRSFRPSPESRKTLSALFGDAAVSETP
ncbi:DUF6030 family protein [Aureimonas sp. ME7]|uniref:DUF6030 family protein n=1 Tax=Aureimonas sp. ME7 TaxID=2744252 RepID=UPI0015F86B63|nr:DUF6030 family protein [Aureimonas sp. ME7]